MVLQKLNTEINNQSSDDLTNEKLKYPSFIKTAVDEYYQRRVKNILHGKTPSQEARHFSSNDYLSISQHPKLINAQISTMQQFGNGQMQSGVFMSSSDSLLHTCEQQFSDFLHYSSSLLSQSGWCANMGLIQALARPNVPVYLDFFSHMSLWAGVKAAGAMPLTFLHNSLDSLHKRLKQYGSGIIAVDSVYSTIGTVSPLAGYVELAKKYNCILIVDESHSLGTHGPQGRGLVAEHGLSGEVDVITASLAKAFSGRGGLITGKEHLIEMIRYTSLPSIFSSALVPHDIAGFSATIELIAEEEWRRKKLHENASYLRESLKELGFNLRGCESQIIAITSGNEHNTVWLRNELENQNIFGAVFCAPATPKNKALIRISVNTNHSKADMDSIIDCLTQIAKKNPDMPFFKPGAETTTQDPNDLKQQIRP